MYYGLDMNYDAYKTPFECHVIRLLTLKQSGKHDCIGIGKITSRYRNGTINPTRGKFYSRL